MASQLFVTTATTQDERDRGAHIAVLPVGSFEQHGPALPLITDTLIACSIAHRIAEANDLLLLPPITISCSHEHADFPGTVSIGARTLHAIIEDIRESFTQGWNPQAGPREWPWWELRHLERHSRGERGRVACDSVPDS